MPPTRNADRIEQWQIKRVRIVPDAAERDVRLRAARAVASAHRLEADGGRTAVDRRATGRPVRIAGAATGPAANAGVAATDPAAIARVASVAAEPDRVATDRGVTVGV